MKNVSSFTAGMLSAGAIGLACYSVMNKGTKKKADELLNNVMDKVNNSNVMKKSSN